MPELCLNVCSFLGLHFDFFFAFITRMSNLEKASCIWFCILIYLPTSCPSPFLKRLLHLQCPLETSVILQHVWQSNKMHCFYTQNRPRWAADAMCMCWRKIKLVYLMFGLFSIMLHTHYSFNRVIFFLNVVRSKIMYLLQLKVAFVQKTSLGSLNVVWIY